MAIDRTQFVEYYQNLLIAQYRDKPKARAEIEIIAGKMHELTQLAEDVVNAFNLDTAVGVQLDILGRRMGLTRIYSGSEVLSESETYTFNDQTEIYTLNDGMETYNLTEFSSTSSNKLTDEEFRSLLKFARITYNTIHTLGSISDLIFNEFGEIVSIDDNSTMQLTYFFNNFNDNVLQAIIDKELLPRPAGVGINVIASDKKFFAFFTPAGAGSVADDGSTGFATIANPDTGTKFLSSEDFLL